MLIEAILEEDEKQKTLKKKLPIDFLTLTKHIVKYFKL
jgi:hypothetical protein